MLKVGQTIEFTGETVPRRAVLLSGEGDEWVLDDDDRTRMDVGWYVRTGWARIVVPAPEDLAEGQVFWTPNVETYVTYGADREDFWLVRHIATSKRGGRGAFAAWLRDAGWSLVGIRANTGEVVRLGEHRVDACGLDGVVDAIVGRMVHLTTYGGALVDVDKLVMHWRLNESTPDAPEAPPPTLRRGAAPPPAPVVAEEHHQRVRAEEMRTARGVCDTCAAASPSQPRCARSSKASPSAPTSRRAWPRRSRRLPARCDARGAAGFGQPPERGAGHLREGGGAMLTHLLAVIAGAAAAVGVLAVPWWRERCRAARLDRENERLMPIITRLRLERDAARQEAAVLRLRHLEDVGPRTMRPEDLARVRPLLDVGGGP